ncbi:uncharacterized protein LOC119085635 isoform X1 [Bradysia coprophila]|uniref:uncharacterized protein LOC119085635 isoform X1 n=1 Tax=Bradysia coprophila TaxID=38358 RepID=UPI00187DBE2B|nr:uncharacterized protein LOC119085635 isoform X1 [Bradysia coprophila]
MASHQIRRTQICIFTFTAFYFMSAACKSLGSKRMKATEIDHKINACDYEWTAIHGYEDKVKVQAITCPRDGIITEISVTYGDHEEGQRLHSISFKCNSSFGVTDVGPFGDVTGERKTLKCENSNDHIKYIQGAAGQYISDLEVRCVNKNDSTDQIQYRNEPSYNHSDDTVRLDDQQTHIFNRKKTTAIKTFKDACYATKGRRPVEIRIWADKFVNAIQVKYVNVPVSEDCTISHIEYLDSEKHMTPDALNVIGFTSGFTCSTLQQEIALDIADTRSTNIEVEFEDNEIKAIWRMGPMMSLKLGYLGPPLYTGALEYNGLFSVNEEGNGTRNSNSSEPLDQYSIGTTISYHGPGAAILVGYEIRYDVDDKSVPISLHYTCEGGGSLPYTISSMSLHKYKLESAFFLDFHYTFNNVEDCLKSSYAQECVADIKIKDFIANPNELEKEFFRCFDESSVKIPFGMSSQT